MKKKFVVSSKDKKDWMLFTKQMGSIGVKEADLVHKNTKVNKKESGMAAPQRTAATPLWKLGNLALARPFKMSRSRR